MLVGFDYTLDELLEVRKRVQERLKIDLSVKISDVVYFSFCIACCTYVVAGSPRLHSIPVSIGVGVAVSLIYTFLRRKQIRDVSRSQCSALMGGQDTKHFEVELGPEGYWVREKNVERLQSWRVLESVSETGGDIEMWTKTCDLTVVRRRAFHSQEDYDAFLAEVRSHLPGNSSVDIK